MRPESAFVQQLFFKRKRSDISTMFFVQKHSANVVTGIDVWTPAEIS